MTRTVWLPAKINPDGTIENIIQGKVENQGPKKGHAVKINGKRRWIEGQHNHNRQRNPRNVEEPVLGTRLMNTNPEMIVTREPDGRPSRYLVDDARIVRLGRLIQIHEMDNWQQIAAEVRNKVASVLHSATRQGVMGREQAGNVSGKGVPR